MDYKKILYKLFLCLKEKRLKDGGKYLLLKDNSSTDLIIVFSGFSETRNYQYMRSLKKAKINKLFIADMWGYDGVGNKGSYYWFHNGTALPETQTSKIIEDVLSKKSYRNIYMAGSSKGGTCAIYYGLKYKVKKVFAGACQYNVGNYLKLYPNILHGMMGREDDAIVKLLNNKCRDQIVANKGCNTQICLLYSKEEHTYEDDIVDLIADLKNYQYDVSLEERNFSDHSDIGIHFSNYLKDLF